MRGPFESVVSLFRSPPKGPARGRIEIDHDGPFYAIGDVHGCLNALRLLEDKIIEDSAAVAAPVTVIMLGDYVDRGPRSAQVLDHLLKTQSAFQRVCLAGNHDVYMQRFLQNPHLGDGWVQLGGEQTLNSYGIDLASFARLRRTQAMRDMLESYIPDEHRAFLADLPVMIRTRSWLFVHAGLRPGRPLASQADADMLEGRIGFDVDYSEWGRTVVHGHTVTREAFLSPSRISIDTGAYLGGALTAVRLFAGEKPRTLSVHAAETAG